MPKPPPTERFVIRCEVEAADLGPTVAQLTKLGLTNVHFELVTDVPVFRQKTNHEVKAEDFLTLWTEEHPTFKAIEAINHFRDNGRTAGAAYSALRTMCDSKVLKKLGPGNYARADVQAIAAPEKKAKAEKAGNRFEVTNGEFILRLARRAHGRISLAKIKQAFTDDETRTVTSVPPTIADLIKKKRIKRDGDGMIEVIPDAPAKHLNGAAEGVAANG